jgi:hypothetical protein
VGGALASFVPNVGQGKACSQSDHPWKMKP